MIRKIAIDLDGVLGRFMEHACNAHGIPYRPDLYPAGVYDTAKLIEVSGLTRMTQQAFWDRFDFEFWDTMPWTEDGKMILDMAFKKVGRQNVCIATSPSLNPQSAAGKMSWIQREVPELKRQYFIGSAKYFLANPEMALMDDYDRNIGEFIAHGGVGITVPRIWNSEHVNKDHVQSYLLRRLSEV